MHCHALSIALELAIPHLQVSRIRVSYLIVCINIVCCSVAIGHRGDQHHTYVANGTGEKIQVEIAHDGVTYKHILEKDEVHCEETSDTWVQIKVIDDQGEMRTLQSDYGVVIRKTSDGLFKIRRVRYGTIWEELDDTMGMHIYTCLDTLTFKLGTVHECT